MTRLQAGARIGILGGGQLGRMLSLAAAKLGFDVSVYCPEENAPAARISAETVCADYRASTALRQWARSCDVITYEFENVPVDAVEDLIEAGHCVRPGAKALHVSQDRLIEKTYLQESCAIPTAAFKAIESAEEIAAAVAEFDGQGILKTRREGYDGKGQARIVSGDDYRAAHKALGLRPAILEAMIPFDSEISVIIARDKEGQTSCYDIPLNQHVNGILKRSTVPSNLGKDILDTAYTGAKRLVESLDYVGVLALEYFVLPDGSLIANEFAPRVHNSGHWTPEACATGQFEQHIRAIVGWPLGSAQRFRTVEMENLLGEEALAAPAQLQPSESLTLYGKQEAKAGRKMGHIVRWRA